MCNNASSQSYLVEAGGVAPPSETPSVAFTDIKDYLVVVPSLGIEFDGEPARTNNELAPGIGLQQVGAVFADKLELNTVHGQVPFREQVRAADFWGTELIELLEIFGDLIFVFEIVFEFALSFAEFFLIEFVCR